MHNILLRRFLNSCSDNRKSKIENLKLVGIFALVVTLAIGGAVAQAQPSKVYSVGLVSLGYFD